MSTIVYYPEAQEIFNKLIQMGAEFDQKCTHNESSLTGTYKMAYMVGALDVVNELLNVGRPIDSGTLKALVEGLVIDVVSWTMVRGKV